MQLERGPRWLGTLSLALLVGLPAAPARAAQDIVFLMDGSGSVGPLNYELEKQFVLGVLLNALHPGDRVGIIPFATDVQPSYQLTDDQAPAALVDWVQALPHTGGWTNTPAAGQAALAMFDSQSAPSTDKLMVIVIDGDPVVSGVPVEVCMLQQPILAAGIRVLLIGVGYGWTPERHACLVENPDEDMILVESFNQLDYFALESTLAPYFPAPPPPSVGAPEVPTLGPLGLLLLAGALALTLRRRLALA